MSFLVVATGLENYAMLLRKTNREAEAAKLEARVKAIRAVHSEANPLQYEIDNILVTTRLSQTQRRLPVIGPGVDIGLVGEEYLCYSRLSFHCRPM